MKEKLQYLSPALVVLALLAVAGSLLAFEREFLWKVQELNLFLDTPLFLRQQMVTSGWLLSWLGCYFTEFFYVPWLGVALLTLWWAVLLLVVWRTFQIPVQWLAVLLIPLSAVVIMNVDVGYWVYYLKLQGHFFAAAIGTTLAVCAVWVFRLLPAKYFLRPVFLFAATGMLYPLIGFFALLGALLMVVVLWRLDGLTLTARLVSTVVAVASVVGWPLCYYYTVFCQTSLQNIWWTGLPVFILDRELPAYYIPYGVLAASLVFLALMYGRWQHWRLSVRSPLPWLSAHAILVAVAYFCIYHFWYKDYNFHKELRMQQCIENLDWEGVLAEDVPGDEDANATHSDKEPTRAIVMMRNLALFRLGRQGDEVFRYQDGSRHCDTPVPIRMMQVAGYSMYYNYGIANYCHRWCLEQGVEFGFRAEYLKYLMRCALVIGDNQEARKYAALLKHTRYHKSWASHYERFIGHPRELAVSSEFQPILQLMTNGDVLASDRMLAEKFLMERFLRSDSNQKLYHEQALLSALWMKDIPQFWRCFSIYVRSHAGERMPRHYQEAAYLFGHLDNRVDIGQMPFDDQVKRDYADFMALANNAPTTDEAALRSLFYTRFGHTFYYNYFFVNDLELY